jgi:enoyl-CoA hydratase
MMKTLEVGKRDSIKKVFTKKEVEGFAEISTDKNPIHLDDEFAKNSVFGGRVVHGMLLASLFSGILGQKLPGEGTIYLGQNLTFKKPVFIDEEVTASVEIIQVREDKPIVKLKTLCLNSKGEVAIEGEAVVRVDPR